ncbi:MAG: protein phosphatase 2C domain-containing protein [Muribaculaceae bacterium]|nr:protein phosphatase 2C domain-containing protein [Muribaculaceae bacterium]
MSDYIIPAPAASFCRRGAREEQQDARHPDSDRPERGARTFVVCDGVGGEKDGAVASQTVCKAFADFMGGYADPAYELTQRTFRDAITFAYHRLLKAIRHSGGSDMATTLAFLHFNARNALVAHMGDSRVYHIRPGVGILYRTCDHSLVNVLVHSGNLTPAQAINHPKSNVITRCMSYVEPGGEPSAADMIMLTDIEAGDYFLLCTDGVTQLVDDRHITELLDTDIPDEEKTARLAAMCDGSTDNNTAILVRVADAPRLASAVGETSPNEEIERVKPSIPQSATCRLYDAGPEVSRVIPDNALPLHRKVAGRLRDLLS